METIEGIVIRNRQYTRNRKKTSRKPQGVKVYTSFVEW